MIGLALSASAADHDPIAIAVHIHRAQAITLARTTSAAAITNVKERAVVMAGNLTIREESILPCGAHGAITVRAVGAKSAGHRVAENHKAEEITARSKLYVHGAIAIKFVHTADPISFAGRMGKPLPGGPTKASEEAAASHYSAAALCMLVLSPGWAVMPGMRRAGRASLVGAAMPPLRGIL